MAKAVVTRDQKIRLFDEFMEMEPHDRWRAVHDWAIENNSFIAEQCKDTAKQAAEMREAKKKDSSIKLTLSMPEALWAMLKMFDSDLEYEMSNKHRDKKRSMKATQELRDVFPEYAV